MKNEERNKEVVLFFILVLRGENIRLLRDKSGLRTMKRIIIW